jgi:hypothetical protein
MHRAVAMDNIEAGDVLLCFKADKTPSERTISRMTGSGYTHAAICVGDGLAAGSSESGFEVEPLRDLIGFFDHVAVFRQADAWSPRRKRALRLFADKLLAEAARYPGVEVLRHFKKTKQAHEGSLHEQLTMFFEGTLEPTSQEKGEYFCSEFVAACFIYVGYIEPSAAVIFNPKAISPGDLGKDAVWGTFVGYISALDDYEVPAEDEFYNHTTFSEIHPHRR